MEISLAPPVLLAVLVGVVLGALGATLAARTRYAVPLAVARSERDSLRERVARLGREAQDESAALQALAPLRESLTRVERQVGLLERDRVEQFGELGERLAHLATSTNELRDSTTSLAGSLNASSVRGAWGEAQLRRVLEHAGMLPRCDFDEQVEAVTAHEARVRPDVVVRLPGSKCLVVDAKAPLSAFLSAQADGLDAPDRQARLRAHARALRGHVDALAAKAYWSAFTTTPEMVVCFVPGDAILAAALQADPGLYDDAQSRRVVLASPATLLALLRSVAFAWRQDALADNARELLAVGTDLHARLATLGGHVTRLGSSLRKSVESYNAAVGTLESRVLVTARRLRDLGAGGDPLDAPPVLEVAPRPLTASELLDAATPTRPELDLDGGRGDSLGLDAAGSRDRRSG